MKSSESLNTLLTGELLYRMGPLAPDNDKKKQEEGGSVGAEA